MSKLQVARTFDENFYIIDTEDNLISPMDKTVVTVQAVYDAMSDEHTDITEIQRVIQRSLDIHHKQG